MAGKATSFANAVLKAWFWNEAIPGISDPAVSGALTHFYIGLHSGDPRTVPASGQSALELDYTGYGRVGRLRDNTAWDIVDNEVSPVADIEFGERTDSGALQSATWMSNGTHASGTGQVLFAVALPTPIPIEEGTVPRLRETGTLTEL